MFVVTISNASRKDFKASANECPSTDGRTYHAVTSGNLVMTVPANGLTEPWGEGFNTGPLIKRNGLPARQRTRRLISIAISKNDWTGILAEDTPASQLLNNSSITSDVVCQTAAFMPSLNAGPTILRWWRHSSPSVLTKLFPNTLKIRRKAGGLGNFTLCRIISCVRVSSKQGYGHHVCTFATSLSATSSIVLGVGRRERTAITSQPTSWKTAFF